MHVDPTLVTQALTNLLDNAAKYTPPQTRIRIAAVADGRMVRIIVEDEDQGSPQGIRACCSKSSSAGATRAPSLARASGSRSAAPSSRRTVARSAPVPARAGALASSSRCRWRPTGRDTGDAQDPRDRGRAGHPRGPARAARSRDYRVVEADTAGRAEIEARTHKPDLLLVDLGLPDADGLEVVRSVRGWSSVPLSCSRPAR